MTNSSLADLGKRLFRRSAQCRFGEWLLDSVWSETGLFRAIGGEHSGQDCDYGKQQLHTPHSLPYSALLRQ